MAEELVIESKQTVIWETGFKERACVKIPFDGRKCAEVSGSVRILLDGDSFYIELQMFGQRARYGLANTCFPFSIGIGSIQACVANLDISGGRLRSLEIRIKICIGTRIVGIPIEKCWNVFSQRIVFFTMAEVENSINEPIDSGYGFAANELHENMKLAGSEYAYMEIPLDEK